MSTADDACAILEVVPSPSNGLTLCAGSYGARADNDLVHMIEELSQNIFFIHLRNIKREADGSFYESDHLDGDNDMLGIMNAQLDEECRRKNNGSIDDIPLRADHGHLIGEEENSSGVRSGLFLCWPNESAGRVKRRVTYP